MFYGDQEAAFTQMRASYGPFGGVMAGGAYAQMMGAGGMAGPAQYGTDPYGQMQGIGAQIRPATYMPPAQAIITPSGQYIQNVGLMRSFGNLVNWNEPPRNVSYYDFGISSASAFGERLGMGAAGATLGLAGVSAGMAFAPAGGAVGSVVGAGIGGAIGSILGPLGTAAGGAVGGMVGGLAGNIGGYMLGSGMSGAVLDLAIQQRNVRNYLETGSFRFATAGVEYSDPRTGYGMNVRSRGKMAELLTEMDIKDPFLNMEELTGILKGAGGLGLLNNQRTMDDFKRRFKEITENVKVVARTLNTTLEEGLRVMKDFRAIGVESPTEVTTALMRGDVLGRVAGRTAREMTELGMQGAEIFRGTGVSMEIGFKATQMNLASIRAARDAGTLAQEAVAQAGGEEALAQRMTASGLSFMQSGLGRATMGAFTIGGGALDPAAMGRFLSGGGMDMSSLAMQAAGRLGTPSNMIRFMGRQEKILSEAGKMYGGQGLQMLRMATAMSEASYLRNQGGMGDLSQEDALRFVLKKQGMSEPEIEANLGMIKNYQQDFEAKQKGAAATARKEMAQTSYENFIGTRLFQKLIADPFTGLKNVIAKPIGRAADELQEGAISFWERNVVGIQSVDTSGVKPRLMLPATPTTTKEQINLDRGGLFSATIGEQLESLAPALQREMGVTVKTGKTLSPDDVILSRRMTSGERVGLGIATGLSVLAPIIGTALVGGTAAAMASDDEARTESDRYITRKDYETSLARAKRFRVTGADLASKEFRDLQKTYQDRLSATFPHGETVAVGLSRMGSAKDMILTLTGKKTLEEVTAREHEAAIQTISALNLGGKQNEIVKEYTGLNEKLLKSDQAVSVDALKKQIDERKNLAKNIEEQFLTKRQKRTWVDPKTGETKEYYDETKIGEATPEVLGILSKMGELNKPGMDQKTREARRGELADQLIRQFRSQGMEERDIATAVGKLTGAWSLQGQLLATEGGIQYEREKSARTQLASRLDIVASTEGRTEEQKREIKRLKEVISVEGPVDVQKFIATVADSKILSAMPETAGTARIGKGLLNLEQLWDDNKFEKWLQTDAGKAAAAKKGTGGAQGLRKMRKENFQEFLEKAVPETLQDVGVSSAELAGAKSDKWSSDKVMQSILNLNFAKDDLGVQKPGAIGGAGSPQEAYATLTNINLASLEVLKAMHAKLYGGK